MKTSRSLTLFLSLVLCLAGSSSWAQGKPKECFSKSEERAEQIVRDGIRLREGAAACDGSPYFMQTLPLWKEIDSQYGARFAQQTKIRDNALLREFSDDLDNNPRAWNGRIVNHYRYYNYSDTYCQSIKDMLTNIKTKGWGVFDKQSKTGRDEVGMDYRTCDH